MYIPARPPKRTHDTSLAGYHVKDIESVAETLNNAAAAAFPNRWKPRYTGVHVLLLSWEEDDLGVNTELAELERIFRVDYHFHTEYWEIPTIMSHRQMSSRLRKFLDKYDSKNNLLILYYAGHGGMNDNRQHIWSCNGQPGSPIVLWYGLQIELEVAKSDVLILLDCCAAASAAEGAENGITELIAACGSETWAPGVGDHSFTRSLVDELRSLYSEGPFSAAKLHHKLLTRIKYWNPRFDPDALVGQNHIAEGKRKTPIHIVLANTLMQGSIQLTPLNPHRPLDTDPAAGAESSSSGLPEQFHNSEPTVSPPTAALPDPDFNRPRVLISVALEEDQWLGTEKWADWLRSMPAFAEFTDIEGIYKSNSILLLLSLPVAFWDLLPENPAFSFIGFITSPNLYDSNGTTRINKGEAAPNLAVMRWQMAARWSRECKNTELFAGSTGQSKASIDDVFSSAESQPAVGTDSDEWQIDLVHESRIHLTNHVGNYKWGWMFKDGPEERRQVLIQWLPVDTHWEDISHSKLLSRVQSFAALLNSGIRGSPKFQTLRCFGCYYSSGGRHWGLIFEFPSTPAEDRPKPIRLIDILHDTSKSVRGRPTLENRFELAFHLASSVLAFHRVRLLHKNLSAHNIIFFKSASISVAEAMRSPYITGLKGTHLEEPTALTLTEGPQADSSQLDYQHPDCSTNHRYRAEYDYYSLGIVLLEIGLWNPLQKWASRYPRLSSRELSGKIISDVLPVVEFYMGSRYRDAINVCLRGDVKFGGKIDITTFETNVLRLKTVEPPPVTKEDYEKCLGKFVDKNLSSFFSKDDPIVKTIAAVAPDKAKEAVTDYQISPSLASKIAQLAFYDFLILCDSSVSMNAETRIPALKDAVKRLFKIATAMNPKGGIPLRFHDNPQLGALDNLTSEWAVEKILRNVKFDTGLSVLEPLRTKILKPLLEKGVKNQLENPTVIIIITDGGVIADFKDCLNSSGYPGPAAAILFCRVGTNPTMDALFDELKCNQKLSDIVCCYKEDLAAKLSRDSSGSYTGELAGQLVQALDAQQT